MVTRLIVLALVSAVIAGCEKETRPVSDFCLLSKPILVSRADVFTPETAKAILDYNERGAALCGWKGGKPSKPSKAH